MFFLRESTMVSTAMMAKMPIVTPSKDKMVLRTFDLSARQAKRKLSKI
jgi:hypothetical protein